MKLGCTVLLVVLGLSRPAWAAAARAEDIASGVAAQEMGSTRVGEVNQGDKSGNGAENGTSGNAGGGGLKSLPLGSSIEITAGTNGLFSLSDVSSQISLFAEVRYRLTPRLQLGGSFAYRYQSANSVSDSALQGLVGPTLNLGLTEEGGLQSAYFVSVLAGVTTGQTTFGNVVQSSATQFTVAASVGKRFAITNQIAYAPSIGVVKEFSFDPNFTIQPISFSIFF